MTIQTGISRRQKSNYWITDLVANNNDNLMHDLNQPGSLADEKPTNELAPTRAEIQAKLERVYLLGVGKSYADGVKPSLAAAGHAVASMARLWGLDKGTPETSTGDRGIVVVVKSEDTAKQLERYGCRLAS